MDDNGTNSNQPPGVKIDPASPTLKVRKRVFGRHTTRLGGIATNASLRIKQFVTRKKPVPQQPSTPIATTQPQAQQAQDAAEQPSPQPAARSSVPNSTAQPLPRQSQQPDSQVHSARTQSNHVTADEHGTPYPPDRLPVTSQTPLTADHEPAQDMAHPDIQKIVSDSNEVLISVRTVFPFTLFPDTITVDRLKVSIHRWDFFFVSQDMSIRIEDLLNITATTGPFLGSVTIASRVITEDHYTITNLWRHDALRLKQIIQGYIIANHNGVDCTHLPKSQLIATLNELGQDAAI